MFCVEGIPQTQGSKVLGVTRDGRPYLRESYSQNIKLWRKAVETAAVAARKRWDWATVTVPVHVEMQFVFKRPKSHYTTRGLLSASGKKMVIPRLDLDKLERAVNDSMTSAGIFQDDALIRSHNTVKGYREQYSGSVPISQGVVVTVWYENEFERKLFDEEAN